MWIIIMFSSTRVIYWKFKTLAKGENIKDLAISAPNFAIMLILDVFFDTWHISKNLKQYFYWNSCPMTFRGSNNNVPTI